MCIALGGLPARSDKPEGPRARSIDAGAESTCAIALYSLPGNQGYQICGARWRLQNLPINFRLNALGARPDTSGFQTGAFLAVQEWDSQSPVSGTGPRQGACPASARIACISQITTTGGVTSNDGINTISWASLGASSGALGVAFVTAAGGFISDVDIQLNKDLNWFFLQDDFGIGAATGAAAGAMGPFCVAICADKFDVQGILAHEIGHALGLGDVNPGTADPWPKDGADAADYTLVMYEYYYPNSSLKRSLGWGDVLGLQRLMLYVASGQ